MVNGQEKNLFAEVYHSTCHLQLMKLLTFSGRPRRCNRLDDPRNGDVRITGTNAGDKAIYQCDRGFVLKGDRIRKCQSNGQWSGNEPICKGNRILKPYCTYYLQLYI